MGLGVLSRRAARIVSRRGSLLALGGALLGAAATPRAVEAGKCGKKAKKKCEKQVQLCETSMEQACEALAPLDPNPCFTACRPCCASLATCDPAESTACLMDCVP